MRSEATPVRLRRPSQRRQAPLQGPRGERQAQVVVRSSFARLCFVPTVRRLKRSRSSWQGRPLQR